MWFLRWLGRILRRELTICYRCRHVITEQYLTNSKCSAVGTYLSKVTGRVEKKYLPDCNERNWAGCCPWYQEKEDKNA